MGWLLTMHVGCSCEIRVDLCLSRRGFCTLVRSVCALKNQASMDCFSSWSTASEIAQASGLALHCSSQRSASSLTFPSGEWYSAFNAASSWSAIRYVALIMQD